MILIPLLLALMAIYAVAGVIVLVVSVIVGAAKAASSFNERAAASRPQSAARSEVCGRTCNPSMTPSASYRPAIYPLPESRVKLLALSYLRNLKLDVLDLYDEVRILYNRLKPWVKSQASKYNERLKAAAVAADKWLSSPDTGKPQPIFRYKAYKPISAPSMTQPAPKEPVIHKHIWFPVQELLPSPKPSSNANAFKPAQNAAVIHRSPPPIQKQQTNIQPQKAQISKQAKHPKHPRVKKSRPAHGLT